jgi:hypothetical protein
LFDGDGSDVHWVEGDFTTIKPACNWDITAEFFDSHWVWKRALGSSHEYGCTRQGQKYISVSYDISELTGDQRGYMCSTLRAGDQPITSYCH